MATAAKSKSVQLRRRISRAMLRARARLKDRARLIVRARVRASKGDFGHRLEP